MKGGGALLVSLGWWQHPWELHSLSFLKLTRWILIFVRKTRAIWGLNDTTNYFNFLATLFARSRLFCFVTYIWSCVFLLVREGAKLREICNTFFYSPSCHFDLALVILSVRNFNKSSKSISTQYSNTYEFWWNMEGGEKWPKSKPFIQKIHNVRVCQFIGTTPAKLAGCDTYDKISISYPSSWNEN